MTESFLIIHSLLLKVLEQFCKVLLKIEPLFFD